MGEPITREEHEEFKKRIEEANHRQDRRIGLLEESVQQVNDLTVSVGKLASSIETMVKEQERQGKRLETLESQDGEMWRKVAGYIITAITGIVIGFIFKQIGM